MIQFQKVQKEIDEPVSITCDKCKKTFSYADADQSMMEIQEFIRISFRGGYGSVFGDGTAVECDICQHCLKDLIGTFCRTADENERM